MKIFTWPVVAGAALGIVAPLLTYNGNPGNMGFCAACFLRDTAGALGLHRAAPLQYIRPELIGLVLGALASAYFLRNSTAWRLRTARSYYAWGLCHDWCADFLRLSVACLFTSRRW